MYQLKDIACAYDSRLVFEQVNQTINKGDYVIIMGENGQGKSTFLDLLTGFKKLEKGEITFEGESLAHIRRHKKAKRAFYARLGILFQDVDIQLFNHTVFDEIAFSLRQADHPEEEVHKRVSDLAQLFSIEHLLERTPYQLSGGEKKKVAFASIMALNPDVYILDEPFNNLAKEATNHLKELLRSLNEAGKTIILSTHHYRHIADEKATVLLFEKGQVERFSWQTIQEDTSLQERLGQY